MKRTIVRVVLAAAAAAGMISGCNTKPAPPKTADGKTVKVVTVSRDDPAELKAVTELKTAAVSYKYRLEVLAGYYDKVGNLDKLRWANQELENLASVQTFRWEGAPEVLPPVGESIAEADEHVLVDSVIAARNRYLAALSNLAELYAQQGQTFKLRLVQNMQQRFDPVRTYMYFLEAEIPPADLKPTEVIPAADALFEKALKTHLEGKPLPAITDYDKQRKALEMFLQLVHDYPRSTRIALAAYYIADIYKEYFNENVRAVNWYQRAWQWDPTITKPARFQAAVVWDYRLKNHEKARQLYRAAIQYEQFNQSNVSFATKRIKELTEQKKP